MVVREATGNPPFVGPPISRQTRHVLRVQCHEVVVCKRPAYFFAETRKETLGMGPPKNWQSRSTLLACPEARQDGSLSLSFSLSFSGRALFEVGLFGGCRFLRSPMLRQTQVKSSFKHAQLHPFKRVQGDSRIQAPPPPLAVRSATHYAKFLGTQAFQFLGGH